MNVISISKFLTAVHFLIVTAFGNYAWAEGGAQVVPAAGGTPAATTTTTTPAPKYSYKGTDQVRLCKQDPEVKKRCDDQCKGSTTSTGGTVSNNPAACIRDCLDNECGSLAEDTTSDTDCKSAYEAYEKTKADADSVCNNLTSDSSSRSTRTSTKDKRQECLARIDECTKRARDTAANSPEGENRDIQTYTTIIDMIQTREIPDPFAALGVQNANSCLVELDSKEAREQEKENARERKELMDEKQKIEDQAVKDKEENDKEINRITEKIQELQKEHKELLAKKDTEMREQLTQNQKDLVDSAKRIRDLNRSISKKNDETRAQSFAFNESMQEISAQKVEEGCRNFLQKAKDCMIKSAKGIADAECKEFPAIRSKGPKATAELKAQLKSVNNTCYERASAAKRKAQFNQQESLKKSSDEVRELQSQLRDEGQRQQINSQNSTKIQEEAQRAKLEAEENLAAQQGRLQGELAQYAQKIQNQQALAQQRLADVTARIQDFENKQRTGLAPKTAAARTAVKNTEDAVSKVVSQCECKRDSKGLLSGTSDSTSKVSGKTCKALKDSLPSGTGGSPLKSKDDSTSR